MKKYLFSYSLEDILQKEGILQRREELQEKVDKLIYAGILDEYQDLEGVELLDFEVEEACQILSEDYNSLKEEYQFIEGEYLNSYQKVGEDLYVPTKEGQGINFKDGGVYFDNRLVFKSTPRTNPSPSLDPDKRPNNRIIRGEDGNKYNVAFYHDGNMMYFNRMQGD